MKPNIGLLNSYARLTCGFTLLAWVTARMIRKPYKDSYPFISLMAGMKIAEGITRFCPLTAFLEDFIRRVNREESNSFSPYQYTTEKEQ